MTLVELVVVLIFLLFSVPVLSNRIGRPSLTYVIYLIAGMALRPFLPHDLRITLGEVGHLGFVLLLFEVGLEIDVPPLRELLGPLKRALLWSAVQYPLVMIIASASGLTWERSFVAAVALTGCSVGLAFPIWMASKAESPGRKAEAMLFLVCLEAVAIILLAVSGSFIKSGLSWRLPLLIVGMVVTVMVVGYMADHSARLLAKILNATSRFRVHTIFLFVFVISAIGERMGLAAPKTAFVLGLFISRTTHEGIALVHHMRPVGQHLLIPLFLLSMGASVPTRMFLTWWALTAVCAGVLLIAVRRMVHRYLVRVPLGDAGVAVTLPNVTIAAIAASQLKTAPETGYGAGWILLASLSMTVAALALSPRASASPTATANSA